MGITISLYQLSCDPKVVDKSSYLTQLGSNISAAPTGPVDILGPTLTLAYNAAWVQANYAYIPEFGRYYYVNDRTVEPGQKITIQLSADPCYTFMAAILEAKAAITRNEFTMPSEVVDNKLPVDPNEKELWSQTMSPNLMDGGRMVFVRLKAAENTN